MVKKPKPRYAHIYQDRYGKWRSYYRRDGRLERIDGEPWSEAWVKTYEKIHSSWRSPRQAGAGADQQDTFAAQARYYMRTRRFLKLAESSRKVYLGELKRLIKGIGSVKVQTISRGMIVRHRDRIADKGAPARAITVVNVIKAVMRTAMDNDLITVNPADKIGQPPGYEPTPRRPWADEEIAIFLKGAHPVARRAFMVLLHTGLRVGDAVKVRRSDIKDGLLPWLTKKKKKPVLIPISAELADELASSLPIESLHLMCAMTGIPLEADYASTIIRKEARRLGIDPPPTAHGLRANAVVFLIEAGCEEWEVGAITGQSPEIVRHYAQGYKRERLVERAVVKIEQHRAKRAKEQK